MATQRVDFICTHDRDTLAIIGGPMSNPRASFACPHCHMPVEADISIQEVVHVEKTEDGKLAWQAELQVEPHKPAHFLVDGPQVKKGNLDNLM